MAKSRAFANLIKTEHLSDFVMALCDAQFRELGHHESGKGFSTPIQVALTLRLANIPVDIFETNLFLNTLIEEDAVQDLARLVGRARVGKRSPD